MTLDFSEMDAIVNRFWNSYHPPISTIKKHEVFQGNLVIDNRMDSIPSPVCSGKKTSRASRKVENKKYIVRLK